LNHWIELCASGEPEGPNSVYSLRNSNVIPVSCVRRESMANTKSSGSKRGFAAMSPEKQREIASKGGKASHGGGRKSSSSR
jgi:hypothetical protein